MSGVSTRGRLGWLLGAALAFVPAARGISVGELLKKSVEDQSLLIGERAGTLVDMLRYERFKDGTPKPPEKIESDKKLADCLARQFAIDPDTRFPKGMLELVSDINSARKRDPATEFDTVLIEFLDDRCGAGSSGRTTISVGELLIRDAGERARVLSVRLRHVINDLLKSAKLPDGTAKPPERMQSDNRMADCMIAALTPPSGAPVSKGILDLMKQLDLANSRDPKLDLDNFLMKYINERCGTGIYQASGKLLDEGPNGEIFYSLEQPQIVVGQPRGQWDIVRPRASLGYRPPAP
jgi:hypothetical protein